MPNWAWWAHPGPCAMMHQVDTAAPLPQMRPLERRFGRTRQRDRDGDEGRPTCFGGPFFGGCQICTVDDDDIQTRNGIDRYRNTWIMLDADGLCATDRKDKVGVNEIIEEAEESTIGCEDSASDPEDSSLEDSSASQAQAVSSMPTHRDSSRWQAKNADEEHMHRELDSVMRSLGSLFTSRGWDISHVSGERYMLNGRTIKLSLLPAGEPLPYFTHLASLAGYDTAENASRITVCDGSLRQPLLDYLMVTGQNENYDQRGTENAAGVAGAGKYLDFNVAFSGDRMIEMKHATIQAEMRRRVGGGGESTRKTALQEEGGRLLIGKSCNPSLASPGLQLPPRGQSSNVSFQDADTIKRSTDMNSFVQ